MIHMKKILILILLALSFPAFSAERIEGPYLILSTPYNEDGSVNYGNLVEEARFAAKWNTPGVIWPQSNDSIDLLSVEERITGMSVLVEEWRKNPKCTRLVLGVNGDDIEEMLVFAREAERLASVSGVDLILASRPPYYGENEQDIVSYFEALAEVAHRPVIIQTYVNEVCPTPSVEMLARLAGKYPETYGWIKEESENLEVNDRQKAELEYPEIKTVFSAWGGWQWLYQSRHTGTRGLISEKVAYAPLTSLIWELMKDNDRKGILTEAYAMYRLLIDQRFVIHDSLRGYALHYFVRLGIFDNMLSRAYSTEPDGPGGTYSKERKAQWKLEKFILSESQKEELDKCYDDMMKFVKKHYKR